MSPEEKCALIASIAQDTQLSLQERNAKIIEITTGTTPQNEAAKPTESVGAKDMSSETKMKLIMSNLQETLNPEIMEEIITKGERPLTIYWGMRSHYVAWHGKD